jgi:hypothetical protein
VIEELCLPTNLNTDSILEELLFVGATSVRLLEGNFRVALLEEAEDYDYQPEDEIVGSGDSMVR